MVSAAAKAALIITIRKARMIFLICFTLPQPSNAEDRFLFGTKRDFTIRRGWQGLCQISSSEGVAILTHGKIRTALLVWSKRTAPIRRAYHSIAEMKEQKAEGRKQKAENSAGLTAYCLLPTAYCLLDFGEH